MDLITTPNLANGDDFYEALIDAHRGLSTEQSHAMNARLILVLSNHIGTMSVLRQALAAVRKGVVPAADDPAADSHAR